MPLDDRPSTLLFVRQVARIGGRELAVPPRGLLGSGWRPGDCDAVGRWLLASRDGVAFVSSDMLCYGGLVASRTAAVPVEQALARLSVLEQVGGRLEVLATIPRLDLRTSDRQAPHARALQKWAETGSPEAPAGVPADVVAEYLGVRRRNMQVLMALLDLTRRGVITRLVIGQDDSSPRGLNMRDQQEVRAGIEARGVADRVLMLSGADELAMDMVVGWMARESSWAPRVRVVYSDEAGALRVPPMESQPLEKTVEDHVALVGASMAWPSEEADVVLYVAVPIPEAERGDVATQQARAAVIAGQVRGMLEAGLPVGLADLQELNRADPALATAVVGALPLCRMEAYAGWNTASNAFGTALAQALAHRLAFRAGFGWDEQRVLESEKTHQAFLLARLVDDWWYQAVVRQRVAPEVAAFPPSPDPLLNLYGPVGMEIRNDLIPWGYRLFDQYFKGRQVFVPAMGRVVALESLGLEVVLPWQRIFEVEVRADVRLR